MKKYAALVGLSLIWGLSFVFIKYLVGPAGVWGTVFLRCMAGAVILLPFLWMKRKKLNRSLPWGALVIVGIFNAGVPWGLIALSETQINSSTAAVLNALTPICTAVIGVVFFSIVLSKRQWIGVLVGFIGVLTIMNFQVAGLFTESAIGIGTMVLATVSYGFSSQFTKKHLQDVSILIITVFTLVIGGGAGVVGMLLTDSSVPLGIWDEPMVLVSVFGLGCLGSGIAHLLFYYMVKEGSAEFATSVTYFIPITAMIWGFVLLDEPVTKNLAAGLVLIFLGVFLATGKRREHPSAKSVRQVS